MATLTQSAPTDQERRAHEMGMHQEQLTGRTQQVFFDIDLNEPWHREISARLYVGDLEQRLRELGLSVAPPPSILDGVRLSFGKALKFRDPRRFGALLYTTDDPLRHRLLSSLGPEPRIRAPA